MVMHILRMYNSKHPHIWDEILPMFNIATTNLFIALLAIVLFRRAWGFNHYAPLMQIFPLNRHRKNLPMLKMSLLKQPTLQGKHVVAEVLTEPLAKKYFFMFIAELASGGGKPQVFSKCFEPMHLTSCMCPNDSLTLVHLC